MACIRRIGTTYNGVARGSTLTGGSAFFKPEINLSIACRFQSYVANTAWILGGNIITNAILKLENIEESVCLGGYFTTYSMFNTKATLHYLSAGNVVAQRISGSTDLKKIEEIEYNREDMKKKLEKVPSNASTKFDMKIGDLWKCSLYYDATRLQKEVDFIFEVIYPLPVTKGFGASTETNGVILGTFFNSNVLGLSMRRFKTGQVGTHSCVCFMNEDQTKFHGKFTATQDDNHSVFDYYKKKFLSGTIEGEKVKVNI